VKNAQAYSPKNSCEDKRSGLLYLKINEKTNALAYSGKRLKQRQTL